LRRGKCLWRSKWKCRIILWIKKKIKIKLMIIIIMMENNLLKGKLKIKAVKSQKAAK